MVRLRLERSEFYTSGWVALQCTSIPFGGVVIPLVARTNSGLVGYLTRVQKKLTTAEIQSRGYAITCISLRQLLKPCSL